MEVAELQSLTTTKPQNAETSDTQPKTAEIQQVGWQFHSKPAPAAQPSVVQQTRAVVRDDAPSHVIVVGCLIGFGILSIALCFSSLPHYWFHRSQFAGRTRSSRAK